MRLQPFHPPWWNNTLARSNFWLGRYDEALQAVNVSFERQPQLVYSLVDRTTIMRGMGRMEEAKLAAEELIRRSPNYKIDNWFATSDPYRNPEDEERIRTLLSKAGLP